MRLKWKPNEFVFLPRKEKALMYAFIDEAIEQEKKEKDKIKK